jgi:hypothetical protein
MIGTASIVGEFGKDQVGWEQLSTTWVGMDAGMLLLGVHPILVLGCPSQTPRNAGPHNLD